MRTLRWAGLLAVAVLGWQGTPARAVDRDAINRAVERGVEGLRRMQQANGTWPHNEIGATALAGLTLLECGAAADDKAVLRAADAVRRASIALTHTYSISLSILFLDRLGDPDDVPLIESLTVRLLAGQSNRGGWTYQCPPIGEAEVRRLTAQVDRRKELVGRRKPPEPGVKRTVKDLPREIQEQLVLVDRLALGGVPNPATGMGGGDNSNTQFATLALWVGRRQGLPVERALARIDARFRGMQMPDGGWCYMEMMGPIGGPPMQMMPPGFGSTATMTCAGLLGLAVADGATIELAKENRRGVRARDLSKDKHLIKGLQTLGTAIEHPRNLRFDPRDFRPPDDPRGPRPEGMVGGRTYYFLWSLERVAVALNLDTIGKKDWYAWGAEILLTNQSPDGSWQGEYADSGADTCFALLFLKRANLARDLTAHLKGKLEDPGEREIRAGGIGGEGLRGGQPGRLKSPIERKSGTPRPITKPIPGQPEDSKSARLASELVQAPADRRAATLEKLRDGKGVAYTEALATAIPRLDEESQQKARSALAQRLTRMKAETLGNYLEDEDPEIRRAAALACATKEIKTLVPNLIPLLRDPEEPVARAAHAALKSLTGQDFGPAARASREQRDQAALKWFQWWSKQHK